MYLTLSHSMLSSSVKFLSQPTNPHLSPLYVSLSASRVTNHASPTPVFSISSPLFQVPYSVTPLFPTSMRNAPILLAPEDGFVLSGPGPERRTAPSLTHCGCSPRRPPGQPRTPACRPR